MKNRSLAVVLAFGVLLILLRSIGHSASIIKGITRFPIGPAPIDPTVFGGVAAGRAHWEAHRSAFPDRTVSLSDTSLSDPIRSLHARFR